VKKLDSRYLTREDFWWYVVIAAMIWRGWSFWWMLAVAIVYGIYQGFRGDPEDKA
jgi:hypothetical protein